MKSIVIPDSVKELGKNMFTNCSSLECMYLSKNIEKIEDESLNVKVRDNFGIVNVHRLKEIVFPENIHELFIPHTWYYEVPLADKMILPEDVGFITNELNSEFVFRTEKAKYNHEVRDKKLYFHNSTVNDATVEDNPIGRRKIEMLNVAKKNRNVLTKITIQDTDIIGEYAFADCKSLTDITLPKNFEEIGSKSFENCQSLRLVLTDGEVKKKSDSFLNTNNVKEANVANLNFDSKKIGGMQYEVITAHKKVGEKSLLIQ